MQSEELRIANDLIIKHDERHRADIEIIGAKQQSIDMVTSINERTRTELAELRAKFQILNDEYNALKINNEKLEQQLNRNRQLIKSKEEIIELQKSAIDKATNSYDEVKEEMKKLAAEHQELNKAHMKLLSEKATKPNKVSVAG